MVGSHLSKHWARVRGLTLLNVSNAVWAALTAASVSLTLALVAAAIVAAATAAGATATVTPSAALPAWEGRAIAAVVWAVVVAAVGLIVMS